ncbi:TonB family protein [Idiomarina ramblicola]|uniref:Protein TonB n=1 Tax=Idiomarina ramblicola TaxID=263724 RepID=A0A432YUI1_9GAMM|nr:TonB family protein [Idiomarina ramblicola]RUO66977.1 hypothetical protein CWI78_10730 [Idiomarina ramblicola]
MIDLLLGYTIATSVGCLFLLVLHKPLLRFLGPKTLYSLWLIMPLIAILTLLSPLIASMTANSVLLLNIEQMPNITTIIEFTTQNQTALADSLTEVESVILMSWFTGTVIMSVLLIIEAIALSCQQSARLGSLKVRRNKQIKTPGVFGLFAPTIQLPACFYSSYSAIERRLILTHEIMHWRRGDTRINLLAWLLLGTQWFNPLMWLSYRRFRADQELACDADVLNGASKTTSTNVSAYAEALLKTTINQPFPRDRGLISLSPCSTHYGYQQGSFTMMKERLTHLKHRHTTRRYPAVICSLFACSLAILWHIPAHSQKNETEAKVDNKSITPIVRIAPSYPKKAVEDNIEGYVDLSFTISNDGSTTDISVVDSEPAGIFDEAVIAALERWRYPPQNDKPMTIRIQMQIGQE